MSQLFDRLVEQRGFSERFLTPKYENLANPFLLPDMKKAVERIKLSVKNGEKVIVYGDYDADGVTASTVMNDILKLIGVEEVETMLPDRFRDGYGMSKKVVQRAEEIGAKLVITVDCGSANADVVEILKENGIDTVITDHHETPETLPRAVAVVNPKRRDIELRAEDLEEKAETLMNLRDLAGVGVAFMVARALMMEGLIPEGQEKWMLDLVVIGTICDSMKMSDENRILCYFGMKVLGKTRRKGLRELLRISGVKRLSSEAIGFQIGPRINAAGRMANAKVAFDLMMAESKVEAAALAVELERLNTERRMQQVMAMKEFAEKGVGKEPVMVVDGNWHEGVLGIIAGRLVEDYQRPAFVLTEVEQGIMKGSGRSFGDFNLAEALKRCSEEIIGGGGHAGAAGVKIKKENLGKFKEKINEYYRSLNLLRQERFFEKTADLEVKKVGELNLDFLAEIESLEPFGVGNEVPIFGLTNVLVLNKKLLGAEEKHLRMLIRGKDGQTIKILAFNAPERWKRIEQGRLVDLLMNLEENEWNGLREVQGKILDLRG